MAPLMQDDMSISCSMDCDSDHHHGKTTTLTASLRPLHEESVRSKPATTTTTTKKSVSFKPGVRVRTTRSRFDYTNDELEACFYDADRMRSMKEAVKSDGRLLHRGSLPESVPSRGLEDRTREGSILKRRSRANAYAAVWFEIDYQKQVRCPPDRIAVAEVYARHTADAAARALEIGRADEREARRCCCCRRTTS